MTLDSQFDKHALRSSARLAAIEVQAHRLGRLRLPAARGGQRRADYLCLLREKLSTRSSGIRHSRSSFALRTLKKSTRRCSWIGRPCKVPKPAENRPATSVAACRCDDCRSGCCTCRMPRRGNPPGGRAGGRALESGSGAGISWILHPYSLEFERRLAHRLR